MPTRPPALRTAATLLLGALSLTACTSTDRPTDLPTPTNSPAQTSLASPSPSTDLTIPPERPAAMDTPSADGAAAAASYFMQLYGYTWATGDTTLLEALSAESCQFCADVLADVEAMTAAGETSTGATTDVRSAIGTEIKPASWYSADLDVVQGPSIRYDGAGAVVSEGAGGHFWLSVALSWDADRWRVDEADVLDPKDT